MKIINPATEEIIQELQPDSAETIQGKWALLQKGQRSWSKIPLTQRIQCLDRFAQLLAKNEDELALILTREMGKPLYEAHNEIKGAIKRVAFFVEHSERYLSSQEMISHPAGKNSFGRSMTIHERLSFEPLGVLNCLSAWNYPYLVGMNVLVPGLLGGNALFYKPSEYAILSGRKITQLFYEAGIPENALQMGIGGGEVGRISLEFPFQGFFFTGSCATGKKIAEIVGPRMVPLGLELGGKDPLYIMNQTKKDSQELQSWAKAAVEGSFYNNGQSCCAVERIYVHEQLYDSFLEFFLQEVAALKVGDPELSGTTQGPLTRKEQIPYLEQQVQDAVEKGAKVWIGGQRRPGKGYYFEPTVLTNVSHSMLVMKEESFGPIIGVQKVQGDEEALGLMQDTPYGLTAAIYCGAPEEEKAKDLLQQLEVGTGYVNCCDRVSPYLPWSGRKHSGIGSTLSYLGILNFVRPKAYHLKVEDS